MNAAPTLVQIRLGAIEAHDRNVRRDVGDLTELAASIREQGLLEPVIVAPGSASDTYVLIAGHRRAKAAELAGRFEIPAIMRADLTDEADQVMAMLVENLQRSDLTPIEEGSAYKQLQIFGIKPDAIAARTGRSKAIVDRRLALTKLSAAVQDRIQAHEITLTDAEAMLEFASDKTATKRLEDAIGTSNWRWILEDERRKRSAVADAKKARARLVKAGVKIVPALTGEQIRRKTGPRYLGTYTGYDSIKLDVKSHAKCPHHAAAEPKSGQVRYVCLKASVHGLTTTAGAESPAERKAREADREQLEGTLATAAGVRREWLAQFLTGGRTLTAVQQDLVLRRSLIAAAVARRGWNVDVAAWLSWLGVDYTRVEGSWEVRLDDESRAGAVEVAGRDPHLVWLAVLAADQELGLESAWSWEQESEGVVDWLSFLVDLGYTLTDFEAAQLDAAKAKAAAAAETDQS